MKQSELIELLSADELKKQLLLSQFLFFILSIILSFFLFDQMTDWFLLWGWNGKEFICYGVIPGLLIVSIDLILMKVFPQRYYDDGGINKKIFKNRTILDIAFITLVIAISEEFLFRGLLQTTFGYITASIIFALAHFRYLKKPVLLISILLISFYIGYLFEVTGNLLITITAHFIVDFLLGLIIRFQK